MKTGPKICSFSLDLKVVSKDAMGSSSFEWLILQGQKGGKALQFVFVEQSGAFLYVTSLRINCFFTTNLD
jgi:hypothetical protein